MYTGVRVRVRVRNKVTVRVRGKNRVRAKVLVLGMPDSCDLNFIMVLLGSRSGLTAEAAQCRLR